MAKANKESVKLTGPALVSGGWHEVGDTVDVYPFQKRQMVFDGQAEGTIDDAFSPGEKESGAPEVLKRRDERDADVWSVDKVYAENDEGADASIGQSADDSGDSGSGKASKK